MIHAMMLVHAVENHLILATVLFNIVHIVRSGIVQFTVPMNVTVIFKTVNIAAHSTASISRTKPQRIADVGRSGVLRAEKNSVSTWIIPIIGVNAVKNLTVPITVAAVIL